MATQRRTLLLAVKAELERTQKDLLALSELRNMADEIDDEEWGAAVPTRAFELCRAAAKNLEASKQAIEEALDNYVTM